MNEPKGKREVPAPTVTDKTGTVVAELFAHFLSCRHRPNGRFSD